MSPKNAIYFLTQKYELAHGHAPRGYGSWAFRLSTMDTDEQLFWVHSANYSDAKKKAIEAARVRGCRDVEVCS